MLEIFLIVKLCRSIGQILREKGRRAGLFQLLAVALWIGGEITGAVVGVLGNLGAGTYVLSLLGAATGAGISFAIASNAKPALALDNQVAEVFE